MHNSILQFLANYSVVFLTLHVLAVAIGLGGATVSDILFFKFLKDKRISKKEQEVLHILKDVILIAIVAIWAFGIAVYVPEATRFNNSPAFMVKTIIVCVITVNGIALHKLIAPYLLHFSLRSAEKMGNLWRHAAFALGAVSVVSWYSAFLLAMLKTVLPSNFALLLGAYLLLLVVGIVGSQLTEKFLVNHA